MDVLKDPSMQRNLHRYVEDIIYGPQVNPTMSAFPLNNNNNKLINEAGSLCSSDSVEEENEIEEQSGRPIQRQIPQSQRGKAKTAFVENN